MAITSKYQWSHAIIIDSLSSSDKSVRQIAAEALGVVGNAETVEPLVKLLGDSDKGIRQTTLDSLEKLGKPAVPQLIEALDDKKIRKYVARALGEIGDKKAIIPLSKIHEGQIAIVVYHDENNDGKLNTGLFWRPKEGYAFSNNYIPRGPPSFSKAVITLKHGDPYYIKLNY